MLPFLQSSTCWSLLCIGLLTTPLQLVRALTMLVSPTASSEHNPGDGNSPGNRGPSDLQLLSGVSSFLPPDDLVRWLPLHELAKLKAMSGDLRPYFAPAVDRVAVAWREQLCPIKAALEDGANLSGQISASKQLAEIGLRALATNDYDMVARVADCLCEGISSRVTAHAVLQKGHHLTNLANIAEQDRSKEVLEDPTTSAHDPSPRIHAVHSVVRFLLAVLVELEMTSVTSWSEDDFTSRREKIMNSLFHLGLSEARGMVKPDGSLYGPESETWTPTPERTPVLSTLMEAAFPTSSNEQDENERTEKIFCMCIFHHLHHSNISSFTTMRTIIHDVESS